MFSDYSVFLQIFLGILGFGLAMMFCTTICRLCHRQRDDPISRRSIRHSDQGRLPQSIYFIPFPRSIPQQDSEDQGGDAMRPPRYSTTVYSGPPPAYNELEFKPDELPPAYNEQSISMYPITPPPPRPDMVQPQAQ
ncbi:uncharacterized protein LOC143421510 [Maylandia zebra]|uniref:uncharacterized protein si:dkey-283b1.6 n=1 Tax=Haplochromis burtoni TaxID=8153 RepID=UPI001C2DACA5|nr:uncharacterized protein si:dkey-283b1.6 [Haplochromis burtoni]